MPKQTFMRLPPEKQERLTRAAIAEFTRCGFERAKVEDIAAGAGVAKGSVYQYFEDKRELFIHCARWGLDVFMRKLDRLAPAGDMDVFAYFREAGSKLEVALEERELTLFMQAIAREPGLADDAMRGMYEVADGYVVRLIRNSIRKGVVRAGLDEELIKEYFLGVTDRFERRWMARYIDFAATPPIEQEEAMRRELDQMLDLLKNGMGC